MNKIFKLFPVALALVALASCSNDDLLEKNASKAVSGKTMEASIENFSTATRAAFAENKNDAGKADKRALVWTAGDSYKVYGELATADKYTLQNASDGTANGTFDLMTEDYNEKPAFAVFPYDKIEADRASSKLTVTLSNWTYKTATAKDEGYNQGGFVSDVPMYGKIGEDPTQVSFGYMTALLRVDLSKLPKQTNRLIIVTDRPLTGTFETEFDVNGAYPEIESPVSNDTEKDNSTLINGSAVKNYIMAVSTEPVSQRTNKTFFIAVPTGNKYNVFDLYVEYNMAGSTKTELVGQLGNTQRLADGKSILKWERGKVKSLTKEITVTATGNTPKALAAFLAAEWKTFPAEGDINITVAKDGVATAIDMSGTYDERTFTVPAALKDRVVNIIVDESISDGFSTTANLLIKDEDQAPVASEAKRLINFCVPTTKAIAVNIQAPETQVSFTTPDGTTAKYGTIGVSDAALVSYADMSKGAAGLYIGENVTTNHIVLADGSLICEAKETKNIENRGNYDILVKGGSNGTITAKGNGAIEVVNAVTTGAITAEDGDITITESNTGAINVNGDGAVTVTGKSDKSNTVGLITVKGAGDINVSYVDMANIEDGATNTGAITVSNVNTFQTNHALSNADHAADITVSNVSTHTLFNYAGKGKVTFTNVKGNGTDSDINVTSTATTQPLSATGLSGSFKHVNYAGTGAVNVEGVAAGVTLTDDVTIKGGAVTLKNVIGTSGKKISKTGTGALVMESINLQTVENAGGTITATGEKTTSVTRQSIAALTQKGAAKVTLNNMYDVTTLTLSANADVDYENTYIGTLAANSKTTTINGTKASGIGTLTGASNNLTVQTDVWDGTSYCPTLTTNIYTSGSFAKLKDATSSAQVALFTDIDLGSNLFAGIGTSVTALRGYKAQDGTTLQVKTISNLKAATGLFKNNTAALTVSNITLKDAEITATANAGTLVGKAAKSVTLVNFTVDGTTIGAASTGLGTDAYLGGVIGQVDASGESITAHNATVKNANIKGHYYLGGIIGGVKAAANVYLYGASSNVIDDEKGTVTQNLTFTPVSVDNSWSTLKSGTIAPFIGGIESLTGTLNIYGTCEAIDRAALKWSENFLTADETIKFKGTVRDDINFIGYTNTDCADFTYALKLVSGFQANPKMTRRNTSASGTILDTEYNVYAAY